MYIKVLTTNVIGRYIILIKLKLCRIVIVTTYFRECFSKELSFILICFYCSTITRDF